MKVLEQKQWTVTVTCTGRGNNQQGCGSILEVEKEDIRFYKGKSGDPAIDGTFFYAEPEAVIRCPVCGTLTDLTKEQRPVDFRDCTPFTVKWANNEEQ